MAGSSRGNPKLGDIIRSVGVLGVGLLVVWGVAHLFYGNAPKEPQVPAVDYAAVLPGAERETGADLLAPTSLPEGWKVTSSRVREEVWSLGTLTDDQRFIGIQQAPGAEEATVEELVPGSERVAEVEIGDQTWTAGTRWRAARRAPRARATPRGRLRRFRGAAPRTPAPREPARRRGRGWCRARAQSACGVSSVRSVVTWALPSARRTTKAAGTSATEVSTCPSVVCATA